MVEAAWRRRSTLKLMMTEMECIVLHSSDVRSYVYLLF